jgi:hypothetical protein
VIAPADVSWVRVLEYSTHVGQQVQIRGGAVRWLLRRFQPELVVLTEVQLPAARRRARIVFPPSSWSAVGFRPASTGPHSAGTLVLAHRSVFKKVGGSNVLLSAAVPGDKFLPERRRTVGQFEHRATGRVLDVGAVHLWVIGNKGPRVRAEHLDQLASHVDSAQEARAAGRFPIRAGDLNEWIRGDGTSAAERGFRAADLVPARPTADKAQRLDEIFVPIEAPLRNYQAIHPPAHMTGVEGHHLAVVVDVGLTRKAAP